MMILAGSSSCQKELDGTITGGGGTVTGGGTTVSQKPKLGTKWYYRYSTFNSGGGFIESHDVTYKAVSEETLGGEKWMNIIDSATNTPVWLLNEKTGGLYHYANSSSRLLCKNPAALNDVYNTYNGSLTCDFTVKGIKDSIPLGLLGNVAVNYYEGSLLPPPPGTLQIVDKIWYNENVWIAQRYYYNKGLLGDIYTRRATIILQNIAY